MATVVNNSGEQPSGNGMGFVLGIILLIVFVILLIYYGIPALRGTGGGTQLNVPSNVNVGVKK